MSFSETSIRVSHADAKVRSIHLRDLPAEVSDDDVSSFFSSFGEVVSFKRSTFDGFPALYNGNRVVKISLDNEVSYFVRVHDFLCRAWYAVSLVMCLRLPSLWSVPALPLARSLTRGECRQARKFLLVVLSLVTMIVLSTFLLLMMVSE